MRRLHTSLGQVPVKGQLVHEVHVVKSHGEMGGVNSSRDGEVEGKVADRGPAV